MLKFQHYIWILLSPIFLSACSTQGWLHTPPPVKPHVAPSRPAKAKHVRVQVFSHGWHTGIVIPSKELQKQTWTRDLKLGSSPQMEFGWGAEEFYRRPDLTVPMVIRGLCWPTDAVVHVERFTTTPYKHYYPHNHPKSQLITLEISSQQCQNMIRELRRSFSVKDNHLVNLGKGIEPDSTFFRSAFTYYYPETCNIWTARILRAADIPITPSTRAPKLMNALRETPQFIQ